MEGQTGNAGTSQQQGEPSEQRELQLDMQSMESDMEECVPKPYNLMPSLPSGQRELQLDMQSTESGMDERAHKP